MSNFSEYAEPETSSLDTRNEELSCKCVSKEKPWRAACEKVEDRTPQEIFDDFYKDGFQ